MERPTISIGMSVYNSETTIAAAVASLLAQTFQHWELLLLDDGSQDRTLEVAGRFRDARIRVIADGRNLGLAARLNQAVDLATGDYFARMDADDVAYPQRLEKQLAFLQANPAVDLLGTSALVFRGDGTVVGLLPCRTSHEEIVRAPWNGFNSLIHPTWLGRTDWFRRHRFDARMRKSQDRDVLLRAFRESRFACLPEVLLGYRQETLDLRKILKSRAYFSYILVLTAARQRNPAFLWGVVLQLLKSATDVVAITTGLNYRLLGHRAASVDDRLVAEWQQLWAGVRSAGA